MSPFVNLLNDRNEGDWIIKDGWLEYMEDDEDRTEKALLGPMRQLNDKI